VVQEVQQEAGDGGQGGYQSDDSDIYLRVRAFVL